MSLLLRIAKCLICSGTLAVTAASLDRPYTVENYDVTLQADLAKQSIDGEANIRIHSLTDTAISALEFDAGGIRIGVCSRDRRRSGSSEEADC